MLPTTSRSWALYLAILMCAICLPVLSKPPKPEAIEAAQDESDLKHMKKDLGPSGCAHIGFSLGFDYLFMAAYVTAIGLGCAMVAEKLGALLHPLGTILAYAQIAGGLIDASENACLIRLLSGGFDQRVMTMARLATASKFTIPVAGIGYILVALVLSGWSRV